MSVCSMDDKTMVTQTRVARGSVHLKVVVTFPQRVLSAISFST